MPELSLFLPLTKVDAVNRLVYGVATAEAPDRSGEVCDYASTKPFYEKWSGGIAKATDGRSLGNLRAMHGKVAAGKVTQIAFNDDARQIEICAKVVDDAEWRKVEEGVYTGFSQGGAYAKRWKGEDGLMRYTADPSEVSLVDLPCLPSATFQVLKADGAAETRPFADSVRIAPPPEPTNAAVLAKAEDLAAAAGRPDEVGDFVAPAREALVKASEAAALAQALSAPEPPSAPSPAEGAPVTDGEVAQVWKAKDGATFAKKADALAHNTRVEAEASAKAAAGPVLDALSDLGKRLGAGDGDAAPAPDRPRKRSRAEVEKTAGGSVAGADLAKDLYGVSRLAVLLCEIKSMVGSAVFDVVYADGDAALPRQMKAWALQGVTLLQTMVAAEMADLMDDAPTDEAMALAAGPLSDAAYDALVKAIPADDPGGRALAKVGARNSQADRERIQRMHDDACGLGATCGGEARKAAGGDLIKGGDAIEAVRAELAKMTGQRDALQKTLTDEVLPQIAALAKMVGDQPVPRHLVGRAVTKGTEGASGTIEAPSADAIRDHLAKLSAEERADLLIKVSHQNPQQLALAR
ncbi:hypothetical protein QO001_002211 [Methylobacterium brachiatum]|uniref:Prohead serine protease n=1 Tax=Methylobacterium brachiatum TaxID=269660 RepID=A0AAJ1WWJ3_9HYPH|nr:hypothetical protein [Methylobacterium brachiatum]MCB4802659.1 hypothetical protein [Methylobacterium brachiatum]MDQ0543285.1 hypothetical protein [Methylobacterium brachiatum]